MEHLILIFGILIGAAALLTVLLSFAKQSPIIAFIIVGVVVGLFKESVHIPHEIMEAFTEIGIILLLFMAGLEVDFESVRKRWKLLVWNGVGQIILTTFFGAILGYYLLDITTTVAMVYFGICLTLSSTIIVLGFLKAKKQMESFHGQIILGLMVLQDITAVLALVILTSLSGEGSLAISIGLIFVKMAGLAVLLIILNKLILNRLFRYLASAKELLFVGSLGWALGFAAFAEAIHFSPEIGAFMAGAALSFLPYKLEIQDKVEPLKDFGVILFFIALGYGLHIDSSAIDLIAPIAFISVFIVLGTPAIVLLIGHLSKGKSRPSFMIGAIINQISEFSLILATLCLQAAVFDDRIFLAITLATIMTIFISNIGHQSIDKIYAVLKAPLTFIDKRSKVSKTELGDFELKGHYVVVSFNEISEKLISHYLDKGKQVLLIDIDPDVYDVMHDHHSNLCCIYADIYDPDTWDELQFTKAAAIISCMVGGQEAEVSILRWRKEMGLRMPFIATTDSHLEALELYKYGATYVIQTEELAAESFQQLLRGEHGLSMDQLADKGEGHHRKLTRIMGEEPARVWGR
jgi:Kef-type K+ transport system membrane component KefB|tara:strand:+ start:1336 stop:3066 length:1731 start_codon:yes stop_codon:yes gene_type:complete